MIDEPDVLIVGAGPAGLMAARVLRERGISKVTVIEREAQPGGIPRFCQHPTFGMTDFFRLMAGPDYADRLASSVDSGALGLGTTVTSISPDLEVTTSSVDGEKRQRPKRILLATGVRETPRSARLVSGDRPLNVLTAGALQRLTAISHTLPFSRPVIVGTELVAFSTVLTLRDCGVRPVAMLESLSRIRTLRPADVLTRLFLGTPVLVSHRLVSINAREGDGSQMASVTVAGPANEHFDIACDSIIFTGQFVPETSLLATLPPTFLDGGSKGPAVDQCWRLSAPRFFAAGNVLRSVETAAWSAREGAAAAGAIADDLTGRAMKPDHHVPVRCEEPVQLSIPSAIAVPGPRPGPLQMSIRMARSAVGQLTLAIDDRVIWRSSHFSAHPDRRLHVSRNLPDLSNAGSITIGFAEDKV